MKAKIIKTDDYLGYTYHIRKLSYKERPFFIDDFTNNAKWFCGYVEVPEDHPLFGLEYSDPEFPDFEVHGGITFTDFLHETDTYCIGFDCNHYLDDPHIQNADFTEIECLKLIEQVIAEYGYIV